MRQYGCDPHNTQSALREHKHEFAGKVFFFFYFNFNSVTFSVRLQHSWAVGKDTVLLTNAIAFD